MNTAAVGSGFAGGAVNEKGVAAAFVGVRLLGPEEANVRAPVI